MSKTYLDQREDLNDEICAFINKPEGISLGSIAAKQQDQFMQTKTIKVTPSDATKWLKSMVSNRPVAERHVTFIANAMRRGEWALTGQPIIFSGTSTNSKLIDGQHRLLAVIASGCTVEMLAVFGVGEQMYTKLDQGRQRSAGDCLMVANRLPVAQAIKCIFTELSSGKESLITLSNHRPTNEQVLQVFQNHQGVVESASFIAGLKRVRKMIGHGNAAYCLYRMRNDNREEADRFMQRVNTGEGLSARSPVLSLRNQLIDGTKVDGLVSRWKSIDIICAIAFAWHMHLDGKSGNANFGKAYDSWTGWRTSL